MAMFISYLYLKTMEQGADLPVLGWVITPRQSFLMMAFFGGGVLALTLVSAVWTGRAKIDAITLAREYADFCAQRAIVALGEIKNNILQAPGKEFGRAGAHQIAMRDAYACGLIARIGINGLLPVGAVIVAGVSLFIIEVALSTIVFLLLSAAAWHLYRASVQGAGHRKVSERKGRASAIERRRLLERLSYMAAPIGREDRELQFVFQQGATKEWGDAMEAQRQVLERVTLVSNVAIAITAFLILMVKGAGILRDEGDWSTLFAYLIVLSIFTTNFARLARLLTSINRFYPSVSRYARFVDQARSKVEERNKPDSDTKPIRLLVRARSPLGHGDEFVLNRGERLAFLLPEQLSRYHLLSLDAGLELQPRPIGGVRPRWWFAGVGSENPFGSLRETFGFPAGYEWRDLVADIERIGLARSEIGTLPNDLDAPLKGARVLEHGVNLAFVLSAIAGARRGCDIIVFESAGLQRFIDDQRVRLFSLFDEHFIVLAYTLKDMAQVGRFGENVVLAGSGTDLIAWAPIATMKSDPIAMSLFEEKVIAPLRSAKDGMRQQNEAEDLEDDL
ncbi:MAG: hypothetical protein ACREXS_08040 [Gammaproteobacteria bacterium]